jgi:hypothetical protein
MDYEQVRETSHALRAEAAAMVEESHAAVASCQRMHRRMRLPGQAESQLRIRPAAYQTTLADLNAPGDRLYIGLRITEIETSLEVARAARE